MATFDTIVYTNVMRQRFERIAPAMEQARQRLAPEAQALSRRQMEKEIYSKPEDVSPTGHQLWTRTRELLAHERAEVRQPDSVVLTNDQVYAHRRHEANRPGFPFHVNATDPDRTAHWRDDIAPTLLPLQTGHYRQSILNLLSPGAGNGVSAIAGGSPEVHSGGGGGGGEAPEHRKQRKKPAAAFHRRGR